MSRVQDERAATQLSWLAFALLWVLNSLATRILPGRWCLSLCRAMVPHWAACQRLTFTLRCACIFEACDYLFLLGVYAAMLRPKSHLAVALSFVLHLGRGTLVCWTIGTWLLDVSGVGLVPLLAMLYTSCGTTVSHALDPVEAQLAHGRIVYLQRRGPLLACHDDQDLFW